VAAGRSAGRSTNRFGFFVKVRNAKAISVAIPLAMIALADEVIESTGAL
jgi:hypothetical protein